MRILVVEDEHKIANSIKKGLEQENFSVDIVFDGESALDMAETEEYDCIVLDLMLPKINGVQVCSQLRKDENHTPIIMLTAKSELEDKVHGLTMGADDYLTKPFAFEELLARIRALLRRPKDRLENTLKCGDLELNPATFEVKRLDEQVNLTKKEFALLEYLMRNKNKTVTKDQIISHVWNYDSNILDNTVEQYIGYLRNKIDKPFPNKKQLLQTIRGFGYKLTE